MIPQIKTPYGPEEWKDIIYEGKCLNYRISNYGRLYNVDTSRILKSVPDKKGYHIAYIRYAPGKTNRYRIHRLVMKYFGPVQPSKEHNQVNHIDGDKSNNAIWNLEWVTAKENVRHSFATGLHPIYSGEDSSHAHYTKEEIEFAIQSMIYFPYLSSGELEKFLGISRHILNTIRWRKSWNELTSKYKIGELFGEPMKMSTHKKIHRLFMAGHDAKYILTEMKWPKGISDDRKCLIVSHHEHLHSILHNITERSTTIQTAP